MTTLIKPCLDCNLRCKYCYQAKKRDNKFDIDTVINTIKNEYQDRKSCGQECHLVLHGGEPLILGHKNVERILKEMHDNEEKSSIQTNGTLIDNIYIDMFKKYNTHIGISIDGHGKLNMLRCNEKMTEKLLNTIDILLDKDIHCNILSVIHQANAGTDELFDEFINFINSMIDKGLRGGMNFVTANSGYALSVDRSKVVARKMAVNLFDKGVTREWFPFKDVINSLKNDNGVVCIFQECDVYHTRCADVILGDGEHTNCLRGEKYLRHPIHTNTRTEILSKVLKEHGGCKGCKYFKNCYGGCPTNTTDWRLKDYYCELWYSLFEFYDKQINTFTTVNNNINAKCRY